jgi:hypothetical protein
MFGLEVPLERLFVCLFVCLEGRTTSKLGCNSTVLLGASKGYLKKLIFMVRSRVGHLFN